MHTPQSAHIVRLPNEMIHLSCRAEALFPRAIAFQSWIFALAFALVPCSAAKALSITQNPIQVRIGENLAFMEVLSASPSIPPSALVLQGNPGIGDIAFTFRFWASDSIPELLWATVNLEHAGLPDNVVIEPTGLGVIPTEGVDLNIINTQFGPAFAPTSIPRFANPSDLFFVTYQSADALGADFIRAVFATPFDLPPFDSIISATSAPIVVPEPATIVILMHGLLLLCCVRRLTSGSG